MMESWNPIFAEMIDVANQSGHVNPGGLSQE